MGCPPRVPSGAGGVFETHLPSVKRLTSSHQTLTACEHTCYGVLMAKTDYYLGRSSGTALLRDGLEGPALGSVSHSVSFVAHFALLVSHSASFTSRAVSKAKAE